MNSAELSLPLFKQTDAFMKVDLKSFYASNGLIKEFLEGNLRDLHGPEFSKEEVLKFAEKRTFSMQNRIHLTEHLVSQYKNLQIESPVRKNIESLKNEKTMTVTTGHQLNIFTGPLFFIYKILQVINITEELNRCNNGFHFVPVFWMASEDHDFEEISFFNANRKKYKWDRVDGDAVGRMSTEGLGEILDLLKKDLGYDVHQILQVFEDYCKKDTLAHATLYLANKLFGKYGLIVLNADTNSLKNLFKETMKRELVYNKTHIEIHDVISRLDKSGYKVQVNPREINLFYLFKGKRGRIIKENGKYKIANTSLEFTEEDLLDQLQKYPERFSPNVVMRPMYQETILPNLVYLGGAGEIAYWLELKKAFDQYSISFPILAVRNSLILIDSKSERKMNRLHLNPSAFLQGKESLIKSFLLKKNEFMEMNEEENLLIELKRVYEQKVKKVDSSLLPAVEASYARQKKELERLKKKFVRALKQKYEKDIEAIEWVQEHFFPSGDLQERHENVLPYLVQNGWEFLDVIKLNIGAFDQKISFVSLNYDGNPS
ncbi:MAG: bacillithiol biosynthesis cysteine-adding enzyme BshC [Crocinitomicaceae bacterium]